VQSHRRCEPDQVHERRAAGGPRPVDQHERAVRPHQHVVGPHVAVQQALPVRRLLPERLRLGEGVQVRGLPVRQVVGRICREGPPAGERLLAVLRQLLDIHRSWRQCDGVAVQQRERGAQLAVVPRLARRPARDVLEQQHDPTAFVVRRQQLWRARSRRQCRRHTRLPPVQVGRLQVDALVSGLDEAAAAVGAAQAGSDAGREAAECTRRRHDGGPEHILRPGPDVRRQR